MHGDVRDGEPAAATLFDVDDIRAGRLLRALRHRRGATQKQLAERVGVSQQEISILERGHLDAVQLRTIRRVFGVLEASANLEIRWRGGAIDRLIDERHAALLGKASDELAGRGWTVTAEVTYNQYGDRGSIDLVGWHADTATLVVAEIKTELTSLEATLRKHDEKVRLAPRIVAERFGWRAAIAARLLILPEDRTARRQVERADAILRRAYPLRGWDAKRWLKEPTGRGDGLMHLPDTPRRRARQRRDGRDGDEASETRSRCASHYPRQ